MTPEELDYIISATRLRAGAGLHHNNQMVESLCKEAERLVERVRVLEALVVDLKESLPTWYMSEKTIDSLKAFPGEFSGPI